MSRSAVPPIPIARPTLGAAEQAAVRRVLASGWVSQGPEVAAFESAFARAVGARHACAVSSGTAALTLALRAVGVGPGDEVVTVSHSFVATAAVIRHAGATPVFVDVEPATLNLDPSRVARVLTPRTRAILCVHQLGLPCDLAAIVPLARRRGLAVIEDAACAAGSRIRWRGRWEPIGRPHGDLACFSLHPRKVLTAGDGGVVTTASAAWDRQLRRWRQHGVDVAPHARHRARGVIVETYPELGWNYRLTDLQAAVARVQLRRLPGLVARRRALARRYARLLAPLPGVVAPVEPAWARTNWQSYAVRLAPALDPRTVMEHLRKDGIATRPGVSCVHREPAFPSGTWTCGVDQVRCGCPPRICRRLVASEAAQDRVIQLPLYPALRAGDQQRVVAALAAACAPRPGRPTRG